MQQEAPIPVTPQVPRQPNTIQRLFLAFNTPLVSDVPTSEFISNIAQALHLSSPVPDTLKAVTVPVTVHVSRVLKTSLLLLHPLIHRCNHGL